MHGLTAGAAQRLVCMTARPEVLRLLRMLSKRRLRTRQLLQGNFEANLRSRRHLLLVANSCVRTVAILDHLRKFYGTRLHLRSGGILSLWRFVVSGPSIESSGVGKVESTITIVHEVSPNVLILLLTTTMACNAFVAYTN